MLFNLIIVYSQRKLNFNIPTLYWLSVTKHAIKQNTYSNIVHMEFDLMYNMLKKSEW